MFNVINVTNAIFTNEEHTNIDCEVQFAEFPEKHHFHATPHDTTEHGILIYQNLVNGVYGSIASFVPRKIYPEFDITTMKVDSWNVYRLFAESEGAVNHAKEHMGQLRAEPKRISMVTSGSRKYQIIDESQPANILTVGQFNLDLPDMEPEAVYKITAMEPNTEYYCISRRDLKPYEFTRFALEIGESIIVPKLKRAFFGGGQTSYGDGPHIVRAELEDRTITTTKPAFGIIF